MSRVVVLDLRRHNTVLVGHDSFFTLHTGGGVELVRDRCPHRGGPLSLARQTPDGRRLTCPWHGTRVGIAALCRTSVPMVRCGTEATVVLDAAADTAVSVIRRRILANLPAPGPARGAGTPEPDGPARMPHSPARARAAAVTIATTTERVEP